MADVIHLDEFESYLTDLCEKEVMSAEQTLDEVLAKRAVELKGKLNATSPRDTGAYAKGWRMRRGTRNHETVRTIYNAEKPFLTFILEYGSQHQKAQPHIRLALDEEIDQIMEELLEKL